MFRKDVIEINREIPEETTSLKEFTYKECIDFSAEKSKVIRTLQTRADCYFRLINRAKAKGKPLDPGELLKSFAHIDAKLPLPGD